MAQGTYKVVHPNPASPGTALSPYRAYDASWLERVTDGLADLDTTQGPAFARRWPALFFLLWCALTAGIVFLIWRLGRACMHARDSKTGTRA